MRPFRFLFFLLFLLAGTTLAQALTKSEALRELGLKPQSSPTEQEIKKAYRKRSLETHPDKGGSKEEFIRVAESYELLTGTGSCSYDDQNAGAGCGGSDEERFARANEMFFQMFDMFLEDTDAAADKAVDWFCKEILGMKKEDEGMLMKVVRMAARQGAKFLKNQALSDNMQININGHTITGADLRNFRNLAKKRSEQQKKSS